MMEIIEGSYDTDRKVEKDDSGSSRFYGDDQSVRVDQ
jgi:hypothetical protein